MDYGPALPWVHARSDAEALPAVWHMLCSPQWSYLCRDVPQAEVGPALHRMSGGGLITYNSMCCLNALTLEQRWQDSPVHPELAESRSRMMVGRLQALARHLNGVLTQDHLQAGGPPAARPPPAVATGGPPAGDVVSQLAARLNLPAVPDGCASDGAGGFVPLNHAPVFPIGSFLESYDPGRGAWAEFDPSHFLVGTEMLQRHREAAKFTDARAIWLPKLPLLGTFPVWTFDDRSPEATSEWQRQQQAEKPGLSRLLSSTFAYYSQVVALNLPADHPGHLSFPDLFGHIMLLNRLAQVESVSYATYYALQLVGHLVQELRKPPGAGSANQIVLRDWLVYPSRFVADRLRALKDAGRLESLATWTSPGRRTRPGATDGDGEAPLVADYVAPPARRPQQARAKPSAAPSRQSAQQRFRPRATGKGAASSRQPAQSAPPAKRPRVTVAPTLRPQDVSPGSVCLMEHLGHDPPVHCADPGCQFTHVDTRQPEWLDLYAEAWQISKKKHPVGVTPPPPPVRAAGRPR